MECMQTNALSIFPNDVGMLYMVWCGHSLRRVNNCLCPVYLSTVKRSWTAILGIMNFSFWMTTRQPIKISLKMNWLVLLNNIWDGNPLNAHLSSKKIFLWMKFCHKWNELSPSDRKPILCMYNCSLFSVSWNEEVERAGLWLVSIWPLAGIYFIS